ncbi:flippase-like domain-containing protein [bacterium]|nr:flippase-like domain-containing protein [bacterium]
MIESKGKKIWKILFRRVLPLVVTVVLYWFLLDRVDLEKLLMAFQTTRFLPLVVAFIISVLFQVIISAEKYGYILKTSGIPISRKEFYALKIAEFPFKFLSPFRTGELMKPFYLKRKYNITFRKAISTSFVELYLALVAVVVFAGIFLSIMEHNPIFLLLLITVVTVILIPLIKRLFRRKLLTWLDFDGTEEIFTYKVIYVFILVLIQVYGTYITFYFIARSLSLEMSLIQISGLLSVVMIFSALPISVGGMGVREVAICKLFTEFGTNEQLLSLAFLFFIINFLVRALVGLIFVNRVVKGILWGKKED